MTSTISTYTNFQYWCFARKPNMQISMRIYKASEKTGAHRKPPQRGSEGFLQSLQRAGLQHGSAKEWGLVVNSLGYWGMCTEGQIHKVRAFALSCSAWPHTQIMGLNHNGQNL